MDHCGRCGVSSTHLLLLLPQPDTVYHFCPCTMANRHIDTLRPMKVIVIGAGISGILNAIKLQRTVQNLDLVIFDKNAGLGPGSRIGGLERVTCNMLTANDAHSD